jgi:hypothetical protein
LPEVVNDEVSYHEDFEEQSQAMGGGISGRKGASLLKLEESPIWMEPQIVSARGVEQDSLDKQGGAIGAIIEDI